MCVLDIVLSLDLTFFLATFATVLAGVSRGMLGFGAALIIIPSLVALYGPVEAVVIMSLVEVPATLYLLPTTLRTANWAWIVPIGLGSLITVPIGAAVLAHLDPEVTRRLVAGLVLTLGLVLASGWIYRGRAGGGLRLCVGALSGLVGGLANVGGPIVVVFLLASQAAIATVRASMMAFLSFSTVLRVAIYSALGLYSLSLLGLSVALAPSYLLGIWLGSKAFNKVPEALFRRIAIAIVFITGTVAVVK